LNMSLNLPGIDKMHEVVESLKSAVSTYPNGVLDERLDLAATENCSGGDGQPNQPARTGCQIPVSNWKECSPPVFLSLLI
jgi:hypothetical protein